MSYSISKEFHFEYAHRLNMNYDSPCKNLHGHSAKVIITIEHDYLNENDMIEDFVKMKPIKDWLDENFDHSLILNSSDTLNSFEFIKDMKVYILKNTEPTAEVLSKLICHKIPELINYNPKKITVQFYETAKNCASYTWRIYE